MGFDKTSMLVDGVPCAVRVAAVLRCVVAVAVEVGPGVSGLPAVREPSPGSGPLGAIGAGAEALRSAGGSRPALVLACDLPFVTESVLRTLAQWPGAGSVVPVVGGWPQPLCARWSAAHLAAAKDLADAGGRAMRTLLEQPDIALVDETQWPGRLDRRALADVDTPDDLARLGLARPDGG